MEELVFWFDQPPKVGKGCFNALTHIWGNKVIYAYLHGFSETRKTVNWNDGEFGEAEVIELGDNGETSHTIEIIMRKYPKAIHVLCGFKSKIMKYLEQYVLSDNYTFICFAERPGAYGLLWKRIAKRIYVPISEIAIARKYKSHIVAFLPLGMTGVRTYASYGWDKEKLFPFMYDPVCTINPEKVVETHYPVKLLYVGRFSRYTKGTDTLKKSIDLLKDIDVRFRLSLVGGYGDMRDEMIEWAKNKTNVQYLGKWDSLEVGKNMLDYDICIVPSKFDGWNLLVNEAIRANIAVICTNEAVSDEVIRISEAGTVVRANSPILLSNALRTAIMHPEEINRWKNNAMRFKEKISSEVVAQYFIDVIEYSCRNNFQGSAPKCPWLDKE